MNLFLKKVAAMALCLGIVPAVWADTPRNLAAEQFAGALMQPAPQGAEIIRPRPSISSMFGSMTSSVSETVWRVPEKAPGDLNLLGFVPSAAGSYSGYMYHVPMRAGQAFSQASALMVNGGWGGVESNGIYYSLFQMALSPTMAYNYMYGYNSTTWQMTSYKLLNDFTLFSSAMANDPVTNEVYGCFLNADATAYEFGVANLAEATRSTVCQLVRPWGGCAISGEGVLYAIDTLGDLYTVDRTSGAMTLVGSTGVTSEYMAGCCYDTAGDRILRAVCNTGSAALYAIDPATATATLLTNFDGAQNVLGMFVGAPLAADKAPEAPANLRADFPEGALTGKVIFDIPAVCFDGTPAEGSVNWTVKGGYMTYAQGTAEVGTTVEADVTVTFAGSTSFTVSLSNEAGTSPEASLTTFIGKGTPKIPFVQIQQDGGHVVISWDPITETVDGGYMNPDDVTYTVTRYPDRAVIAEDIKECTVTDDIEIPSEPTVYHYVVYAENGDKQSGWGSSLTFTLGSYKVPYCTDFSTNAALITYIDGNNDDTIWTYGAGGMLLMNYTHAVEMDDWFFTPGLVLEAGHQYYAEITFRDMSQFSMGGTAVAPPSIEVKYGNTNTVAAMTGEIAPLNSIAYYANNPVATMFSPETDGECYIGIHAVADNSNGAQVMTIRLRDAAMPAAVSDVEITTPEYDSFNMTVKFTAPTTTVVGDPLESIDKIEVKRGGVVIKTFENPAPGSSLEFEDVIGTGTWLSGNYMWEFAAFNDCGEGLGFSTVKYVGIGVPAKPQNLVVTEEGNTGTVNISWDPVTLDDTGREIPSQYVQYTLYNGPSVIMQSADIEGTSATYALCTPEEQSVAWVGVQAGNMRGSSISFINPFPVGKPYDSYAESFTGGAWSHPYATFDADGGGMWSVYGDDPASAYQSADGDDGFLAFVALGDGSYGTTSSLILGKFNLDNVENPTLSMKLLNVFDGQPGHENRNPIEIIADWGEGYQVVGNIDADLSTVCDPGTYARRSVSLASLKGKGDFSLAIRVQLISYSLTAFDKVRVGATYDNNLSVLDFTANDNVKPGQSAFVTLSVENNGLLDATDYNVELLRGGEKIAGQPGKAVASDGVVYFTFSDPVSVLSGPALAYKACIVYDADSDVADNVTDEITVNVVLPNFPTPKNLSGTPAEGSVELTWDEPDAAVVGDPTTESFEEGEAFATTYGDWTFIDRDGQNTYQLTTADMADGEAPKAFIVVEPGPQDASWYSGNVAYSGNRYLAAWGLMSGEANDDWAISPALSGMAQSITFYAKSLWMEDGGESFRFLYSTGSLNPDDFIEIAKVDAVPAEYTLYSYDIPEGAVYFAINCVSPMGGGFYVDDVTFVSQESGAPLGLIGYNIYRDGAKVNTEVYAENSYTDMITERGTYEYLVTAIYDRGESMPSEKVSVNVTELGIDLPGASAIRVTAGRGTITVSGAAGLPISIVAADGKTVAQTIGKSETTISVAPGFYVATVANRSVKLLVR